jgi:SpoVK/Ycf46/Vps4 family AAA+-type ATPase
MSTWEQTPPPELVSHLAEVSSGYCGSDLKALCTEAVIQGLRRRYPQIYESAEKLLLDPGQVQVEKCDFQAASLGIVPAAHRVTCAPAHKLAPLIRPLMERALVKAVNKLKISFPNCDMKSSAK